jgi:hypothetical protein
LLGEFEIRQICDVSNVFVGDFHARTGL